ncbi:hypothetical protein NQ317_015068 [Molorchus minor]|uniref:Secreted protein n=1 Tax=Molorchus minor TaxID=1323400 RepID=A0ABQ9JM76_9CUCU|nr:hypothetical protein NQ317_015068 [Molorchus minor]
MFIPLGFFVTFTAFSFQLVPAGQPWCATVAVVAPNSSTKGSPKRTAALATPSPHPGRPKNWTPGLSSSGGYWAEVSNVRLAESFEKTESSFMGINFQD